MNKKTKKQPFHRIVERLLFCDGRTLRKITNLEEKTAYIFRMDADCHAVMLVL